MLIEILLLLAFFANSESYPEGYRCTVKFEAEYCHNGGVCYIERIGDHSYPICHCETGFRGIHCTEESTDGTLIGYATDPYTGFATDPYTELSTTDNTGTDTELSTTDNTGTVVTVSNPTLTVIAAAIAILSVLVFLLVVVYKYIRHTVNRFVGSILPSL